MEAHSCRCSSVSQCDKSVTESLYSKWKHLTHLNTHSCFFLVEVNIKTMFIQVSKQVFNPQFKNMLLVNCNPIKKCNSWEFPLSIQILSFKSHFWVSQFSSSLQFIFCDLKMLRKSSQRLMYFSIRMMFCSSSPQIFPSRCWEEPSMWLDHTALNSQANKWMGRCKTWQRHLLLPKSWRLQWNPSSGSAALSGIKV